MKNENRCFFSISLENGIVITGENPKMVKDFLCDISLAMHYTIEKTENAKYDKWKSYITNLTIQVDNAWQTIYNNMKG